MQYLYADGGLYNFMDTETFEQIALSEETIGDALKFVKENEMVTICSHNGDVLQLNHLFRRIRDYRICNLGVQRKHSYKVLQNLQMVETGATVYVPLFVNQGEKIKIDTRTGEYLSRV